MKKFILKLSVFCIPLSAPVFLYLVLDPFKVLYTYAEPINTSHGYQITFNRDVQSTQLFLRNYKKYTYDSFIFGNSRSFFYQCDTWQRLVGGRCFHFNASDESVYGIHRKLKLLAELDIDVKNVLLILDAHTLSGTRNSKGHLFVKHPRLSGESYLGFHLEMFRGFFPAAVFAYTDLYLTGRRKPYMARYGVTNNVWKHDMKTNQLTYYAYDQQIRDNPDVYYADRRRLFYERDGVQRYSAPSIHEEQRALLESIKSMLMSHHTSYRIVISPLYDQFSLSRADVEYLEGVFGVDRVFDLSGINSWTSDYRNYYEDSHYRPFVCDRILEAVYGSPATPVGEAVTPEVRLSPGRLRISSSARR